MENLKAIIEGLRAEMTETLTRWIRVPSVKSESEPGAPFGREVRRCLDMALEDARKMGFSVRNFDSYAGDVRMGPVGVNPLAILAHLDVVPTGDGWQQEPFGAQIIDGKMYGRGTSDDKGPAVAALYAMYAVKKAGIPLKREVRLILGCDEESGWGCMDYYAKHCDMPKTGFSPDASFPVINTEKGGMHLGLHGSYCAEGLRVKEICVGERHNVIPGSASALVYGDAALAADVARAAETLHADIKAEVVDGGLVRLLSTGIPGHAAMPESARNALGQLLVVLKELGVQGALRTVAERVGMESDGRSLGMACEDQVSGALTCSMGIMRYNEQDGLYATLDIRYPILCDYQALAKSATAALAPDVSVTLDSNTVPHHVSPDSPLVKALLAAYTEVTGQPGECVAIGGGTYARVLEEGVAFGSGFPGDEELAHQAGEYIVLDDLVKNLYIFVNAIAKLQD